jgi:hypothetical protein
VRGGRWTTVFVIILLCSAGFAARYLTEAFQVNLIHKFLEDDPAQTPEKPNSERTEKAAGPQIEKELFEARVI